MTTSLVDKLNIETLEPAQMIIVLSFDDSVICNHQNWNNSDYCKPMSLSNQQLQNKVHLDDKGDHIRCNWHYSCTRCHCLDHVSSWNHWLALLTKKEKTTMSIILIRMTTAFLLKVLQQIKKPWTWSCAYFCFLLNTHQQYDKNES